MQWLLLLALLFGFADWRWDLRRGSAPATAVDDGGTATTMDGGNGEPPPPPPK